MIAFGNLELATKLARDIILFGGGGVNGDNSEGCADFLLMERGQPARLRPGLAALPEVVNKTSGHPL